MGKYKIAIFDLDGTLLNTAEGILAATKHTIETFHHRIPSEEVLRTFIGPPIQDSFERVYGLTKEEADVMAAEFRKKYKEDCLFMAEPYEGVYTLMQELHLQGIKVAVATYKRQDYTETILKHFEFDKYLDVYIGSDSEGKFKKNDIIRKCLQDLNCTDNSEAVMIGDSWHDANGAQQIGIDFIGVTYGFDFRSHKDVQQCVSIGSADMAMGILEFL